MIRRRNRKWSWWAPWLALFAILLQATTPALHHPPGMTIASVAGLDVGHNLCIAPGGTAPVDPGKPPAHRVADCMICAAMHGFAGFAPPAAPVIAVNRGYELAIPVVPARFVPRPTYRIRQQPRAPPTFL